MKTFPILFLLLNYVGLNAQNLDSTFVKFYTYSDYLKINNKNGEVGSTIFEIASKLNTQSPLKYFDEATILLNKEQYNEASFIFILGAMRWKYYGNFFKYSEVDYNQKNELEEVINAFLRSNVRNFASILKKASSYHLSNDYIFCSRKKKPFYYDEAAGFYQRLANQILINEAYFSNMWKKERVDFENELKK